MRTFLLLLLPVVASTSSIGNDYDWIPKCEKEVHIPEGVRTIPDNAFANCQSLVSVTIPESVTTIGKRAFYLCKSLTSVDLRSVETIGYQAFFWTGLTEVNIPDSVTTLGEQAFSGCLNLESVTIPESITAIPDMAFFQCKKLTSVTIPDSVTTIGRKAFANSGLATLTIPDTVTAIREKAFRSCEKLQTVTIGNSVTYIGYQAFAYCSTLHTVTIPDSLTLGAGTIDELAFLGAGTIELQRAADCEPGKHITGIIVEPSDWELVLERFREQTCVPNPLCDKMDVQFIKGGCQQYRGDEGKCDGHRYGGWACVYDNTNPASPSCHAKGGHWDFCPQPQSRRLRGAIGA